jgi:hypothetical protein
LENALENLEISCGNSGEFVRNRRKIKWGNSRKLVLGICAGSFELLSLQADTTAASRGCVEETEILGDSQGSVFRVSSCLLASPKS